MDDPALLMQVMESREALEEASTEEEVDAVRKENDGKSSSYLSNTALSRPDVCAR